MYAEDNVYAARQQQLGQAAGMSCGPNGITISKMTSNCPVEPSLYGKAQEAVKFLHAAHDSMDRIADRLNGPSPKADCSAKETSEPSLDGLLATASRLAASLCGRLETISGKIG